MYKNEQGQLIINEAGLDLVKHFEGCKLKAYQDAVGVWTIGWGRTFINGIKVKEGLTCTPPEADRWLISDLELLAATSVRIYLPEEALIGWMDLNENQFSALVCFTYNCGTENFSKLAKVLAEGNKTKAMDNLVKYNKAKGKYLLGLDRRRWAERFLFWGMPWDAFMDIAYFKEFKSNGYGWGGGDKNG